MPVLRLSLAQPWLNHRHAKRRPTLSCDVLEREKTLFVAYEESRLSTDQPSPFSPDQISDHLVDIPAVMSTPVRLSADLIEVRHSRADLLLGREFAVDQV